MLSTARRRSLALAVTGGALAATQLIATPAQAAGPVALCAELGDLGLSRGACASSVATSGATTEDEVVPSGAAYVANCKQLEATDFLTDEEDTRPYPYQFYKGVLDSEAGAAGFLTRIGVPAELAPVVVAAYTENASAFTADNRAGCVQVLRGLHSGALFGLLLPGAP